MCSGQLSLLPFVGREMSSSLRATGWRPSVADGVVVCLHAAPRVQLFVSAGNGWPHNALRYHYLMPVSCHFRDCKALLSMCSSWSSAVSCTWPLPFNRCGNGMGAGKSHGNGTNKLFPCKTLVETLPRGSTWSTKETSDTSLPLSVQSAPPLSSPFTVSHWFVIV